MIKSKSCERRVRVSRSRRDVESQLRPDVAFRASIQSLAKEAHSPVCAHLPLSVSQSQALRARELCKVQNANTTLRLSHDVCVCVCVCV